MRDIETIDAELGILVGERRLAWVLSDPFTSLTTDQLLDERVDQLLDERAAVMCGRSTCSANRSEHLGRCTQPRHLAPGQP